MNLPWEYDCGDHVYVVLGKDHKVIARMFMRADQTWHARVGVKHSDHSTAEEAMEWCETQLSK